MSTVSLECLLPHRKPMLLLEAIVRMGDDEILAKKMIMANDFFLQGHYPDFPIVPGIITCECLFQAGAALLSHRLAGTSLLGDHVPVVARIDSAKFRAPVRPGDEVFYLVKLKEEMGNVYFMKGEALVNDKRVATVDFACALAPRSP